MQIFNEHNDYSDFGKEDWRQFFGLFAGKLDLVNQRLCKAETDRDIFMNECQVIQAQYNDNTHDTEEEIKQRKIAEEELS